ncbi:hypothetical protein M9H77_11212 [Catharanthus roseus]|uniref:Uncharacterized protein n=1 Tax=Catharanthus roseus TaxID=4058 RepID=A0ACC0BE02_CATRO|nr:hypothetical protein M9H77_11212 [Catharanthus roseus]
MATEQSSVLEHSEWRAIQKERERERRRMRDRQRRQSMTSEEREKHLARRRRNYQLRRQRAANAQSGFQFQPQKLNNLINPHEKTTSQAAKNESFALVCVSEEPPASSQPDHGTQLVASNEANHVQNAPAVKYHNSETALTESYKYPIRLRFTQIKHLARLLNSSGNEVLGSSQGLEANAINGEMEVPIWIPRKSIRLVHLKRLIRVLNSKMETTSQQNDSDKIP